MDEPSPSPASGQRISTGIPTLDGILEGGFLRRHAILLAGDTGTGKTTLALQLVAAAGARGERSLYVSMSQDRVGLAAIADALGLELDGGHCCICDHTDFTGTVVDDRDTVFRTDLAELDDFCRQVLDRVERTGARAVVLDTLAEMRLLATDALRFRRALLGLVRAITARGVPLLLMDGPLREHDPVPAMADSVVVFEHHAVDFGDDLRRLRVQKVRGAAYVEGWHELRIGPGGMTVFPRVVPRREAIAAPRTGEDPVYSTGLAELDAVLGGGLDRRMRLLCYGPSGVGKTTLGYQLALAAAARGERSLLWSFDDLPHLMRDRLAQMAPDPTFLDRIDIRHMEQRMMGPGEFARRILDAAERDGLRLLVLDSISGLDATIPAVGGRLDQVQDLMTCLTQRGVLVFMTLAGDGDTTAGPGQQRLSLLADGIIHLQYTVDQGCVQRCLHVVKHRNVAFDDHVRNFRIDSSGLVLGGITPTVSGMVHDAADQAPARRIADGGPHG